MSTLLIKSIQLLSILVVALCGLWLASDYSVNFARAEISPRTSMEQAAAKQTAPEQAILAQTASAQTAPELQALALNYHDPEYKSVMVNGQALRYRRATWEGSPKSLLLALEKQIEDNNDSLQQLRFSQSGPGWFLAGRLPNPERASSHGYMLKADQTLSGTQVWIWDFTTSANASGSVNASGYEQASSGLPNGFIPITNSTLLFSSQSIDPKRQDWLAGFSAPGSVATHSAYYQTMLEQTGYWLARAPLENPTGSHLLAYKNKVEEISISISPAADNAEHIIDIIQFRKHE